jgi:hypothetical protein
VRAATTRLLALSRYHVPQAESTGTAAAICDAAAADLWTRREGVDGGSAASARAGKATPDERVDPDVDARLVALTLDVPTGYGGRPAGWIRPDVGR